MIEALNWCMAYLVCTDGTVTALLVKLGRGFYNLTIQHLRVLISLALALSSSFLNPLTDSSMLPSYTERREQRFSFFFACLLFISLWISISVVEHTFLHAAADAGTVTCLNFILQQFSALIGAKSDGDVRDQGGGLCDNLLWWKHININHNVSVRVWTSEIIQPVSRDQFNRGFQIVSYYSAPQNKLSGNALPECGTGVTDNV